MRAAAARAAESGLGAVRRVHRRHRGWPDREDLLPWLLGFAMAEGVVAAFDWRLIFLLPVALWAGLACWVRLAPLPASDRPRRRFAVCDGGVLVMSREGSTAIPWDAVTEPELGARTVLLRLVWSAGGEEHGLAVGPVTAGRELGRAVANRGPVAARRTPRAAAGALVAAALVMAGWIVWPWLVPAVIGEKPENVHDLARLCWRQDRPFERAAPYDGSGPHPLVFFLEGAGRPRFATAGAGTAPPTPDEVQLVACSYPAGRVSDKPIQVCLYKGGLRLEAYQGRRRLDVYEARTGRLVGRQVLTGIDRLDECAPAKLVYGEPPYSARRSDTFPAPGDFEAALRTYATGPRRS
ncbi:hypothetical protein GWI34_12240 [Actinomadura sp. DSM 109109]|nr:hypothetical protein [Actinomadura lepetitiana]